MAHLWLVERTDDVGYEETQSVILNLPTKEDVIKHIDEFVSWTYGNYVYYGLRSTNSTITQIGVSNDTCPIGLVVQSDHY